MSRDRWKISYGEEGEEASSVEFVTSWGYAEVRDFIGKVLANELDFSEDYQTLIIKVEKVHGKA